MAACGDGSLVSRGSWLTKARPVAGFTVAALTPGTARRAPSTAWTHAGQVSSGNGQLDPLRAGPVPALARRGRRSRLQLLARQRFSHRWLHRFLLSGRIDPHHGRRLTRSWPWLPVGTSVEEAEGPPHTRCDSTRSADRRGAWRSSPRLASPTSTPLIASATRPTPPSRRSGRRQTPRVVPATPGTQEPPGPASERCNPFPYRLGGWIAARM